MNAVAVKKKRVPKVVAVEVEEKIDRRKFNPGRVPISEKPSVTYNLRLAPEHKDMLMEVGGGEWVRSQMDKLIRQRARAAVKTAA